METTSVVRRAVGASDRAGGVDELQPALNTAVVLGARNLGGAITRDLLARGVRVATLARTQPDLDALETAGAIPIRADAADSHQLATALSRASAEIGPPDLIVNAVSATRPPEDGSGFGGGPLAAAGMAGFDGWTVPVARQAFVFLGVGARALTGHGGTLVQVTGAPARRANPPRRSGTAGGCCGTRSSSRTDISFRHRTSAQHGTSRRARGPRPISRL